MRRALHRMSRSPKLARAIFGIEFPAAEPGERYFDLTTPVLVRTIAKRIPRGGRILDMGTGLFATIGLALWRRGYVVTCSDIDPVICGRAREAVALNAAPVEVVRSNLFGSVAGQFDAVTFNPPYVRTDNLLPGEAHLVQSDGGAAGTEVLDRFLHQFRSTGVATTAYVGVSDWHVPREVVLGLVSHHRIVIRKVHGYHLPPVDVYEIGQR